ncbi:MAG: hypothetical protein CR991_01580 [Proteobacteria bacterium]|nr:MAG: hypothetical protein CR991_01580 [Pseudomonadota bacterium]
MALHGGITEKWLIILLRSEASVALGVRMLENYVDRNEDKVAFNIVLYPFVVFGIWLRSLLIRFFATLRYPVRGIKQLPVNWHRISWCMDLTYPPELLPDAKTVGEIFSVSGLFKNFSDSNKDPILVLFLACSWYFPALLWRWSLKATWLSLSPDGTHGALSHSSCWATAISCIWRISGIPIRPAALLLIG